MKSRIFIGIRHPWVYRQYIRERDIDPEIFRRLPESAMKLQGIDRGFIVILTPYYPLDLYPQEILRMLKIRGAKVIEEKDFWREYYGKQRGSSR